MMAPMPIRLVAYISRCADDVSEDAIARLMFEARGLNAINGIRGVMSHDARGFLEVIEGTEDAIEDLIVRLRRDPRHHSMDVLLDEPTDDWQFWGFTDVICPPGKVACPAMYSDWVLAGLSGEVAGAIGRGYALLSQR